MAGVDFPAEERVLQERIAALGWAEHTSVANDTYAVLRAGTDDGWGVGLVCGAGINCVAVAPDGREVRFPALGEITGDWGGGRDVGMSALGGRGTKRGRPRPAHDPRAQGAGSSSGSRRPTKSPRRSTSAASTAAA